MIIDKPFLEFVNEHAKDNVYDLLLKSEHFPGIDVRTAATSIVARKKLIQKVPDWNTVKALVFPNTINAEQASSYLTAKYKQRFCDGNVTIDITGGYGVDSYYLSKVSSELYYIEADPEVFEATKHNFNTLDVDNVKFYNCTVDKGTLSGLKLPYASLLYIDPARRSHTAKRVYAIDDCNPDLLAIKEELLSISTNILVKASPMLDITESLRLIPEIAEVHILSINNECKELLFLIKREASVRSSIRNIPVFTVNFTKHRVEEFNFILDREKDLNPEYLHGEPLEYLYEPNSSIIKSGAFSTIAICYTLYKLARHTHLYSSKIKVPNFPGRSFQIIDSIEYKKKFISKLKSIYPKANITTRNFPLTTEGLKRALGISDGGDIFIFGCTTGDKKMLIICKKSD
ncbi:MAG: class I SAM-dependent methyltransferase [Rikenellaceae bacterium]|nr:class I SAM-dependent methyltransferase [Rikenellaceae bacterium]